MAKKKLTIVTAIKPSRHNRGSPSFLIDFFIDSLSDEYEVNVEKVGYSKINKLGFYLNKVDENQLENNLLVYPNTAYFSISKSASRKRNVVIIGPDSSTLLYSRLHNVAKSSILKLRYKLLKFWFSIIEKKITRHACLVVVGELDSKFSHNARYIPHPYNTQFLMQRGSKSCPLQSVLLFGDLSPKYLKSKHEILQDIQIIQKRLHLNKVIVVGKSGKWLAEFLSSKGLNVETQGWIEDLEEFIYENPAIHYFPLAAGAGTKNRVHASIMTASPVIGSEIALESVFLPNCSNEQLGLNNLEKFISGDTMLNENSVEGIKKRVESYNRSVRQKISGLFNE